MFMVLIVFILGFIVGFITMIMIMDDYSRIIKTEDGFRTNFNDRFYKLTEIEDQSKGSDQ